MHLCIALIYNPQISHAPTEFNQEWNSHEIRTCRTRPVSTPALFCWSTQAINIKIDRLGLFGALDEHHSIEEEGLGTNEGSTAVSVPVLKFGL